MKIVDFKIKRYDLPLVKPLTIGEMKLTHRSGILLLLTDDTGLIGLGESAPLPGLHEESLDEVIQQVKSLKAKIEGLNIEPALFDFDGKLNELFSEDLFPCVRCGIEMALFNLHRQSIEQKNKTININGLVMPGESVYDEVDNLLNNGYTTIKIKVGRQSLNEDIEMVGRLKKITGTKAKLRLDANRSWQIDEAIRFGKAIGLDKIEYIEEPVKTIEDLPLFSNETKIPVALDETIVQQGEECITKFKNVDAIVLKPTLLGGLDRTAQLIRCARKNNKKVCLSSTFESSISLETFAAFAGLMGISDSSHGLDTWRWLAEDLFIQPMKISNGAIDISKQTTSIDNLRTDILTDIEL
jgi:O-succinylbenzoate synthase